jgi:hypothetical protein
MVGNSKLYTKKYQQTHKEEIKIQRRKYRQSHKEEIKKYYENHKEEINRKQRIYRKQNKDKAKAYSKQYYLKNKIKILLKAKTKYEKQRKIILERHREYYNRNVIKIRKWANNYAKYNREKINKYRQKEYKNNVFFRISSIARARIIKALKNNQKQGYTIDLLGCSIRYLKSYLEKKFTKDMNWENWGIGKNKWQIDHIIPCCAFDLTKKLEQKKCFNYKNLQPLWAVDNYAKRKIDKLYIKIRKD